MPETPLVFDRHLARTRLARAHRQGFADFLVARAGVDLAERLGGVLRRFALALDLGTPASSIARDLLRAGLAGEVIRAAWVETDVVADDEALPFGKGRFDLVVSILALQGANDLPGALVQIRHVLAPDGLFMGCLLGGQSLAELRQAFLEAESEVAGGVSPRVAPFADVRDMGGLLQRAGFALPVTDTELVSVRYDNMFGLLRDLRAMGWTNALLARRRSPLRRAVLIRAGEIYARRFSDPDGRVRASFELIWLSGWAPHHSQQTPLAPGSAKARLAEALGATEFGAGEKAKK